MIGWGCLDFRLTGTELRDGWWCSSVSGGKGDSKRTQIETGRVLTFPSLSLSFFLSSFILSSPGLTNNDSYGSPGLEGMPPEDVRYVPANLRPLQLESRPPHAIALILLYTCTETSLSLRLLTAVLYHGPATTGSLRDRY